MDILKLILRHNLLWALLILLFLPGLLGAYRLITHHHLFKWAEGHYRLYGVTDSIPPPEHYDFKHIASHEVQKYAEDTLTGKLPLRSWFIRISNQLYYSLFKTSYSYYNNIIIGKKNTLFERFYIQSYCGLIPMPFDNLIELTAWADKLRTLQTFFAKNHKVFIYLITPNKVEYMSESVPDRYHCVRHGVSQHVRELEKLLKERNINYINASDFIISYANEHHVPLFSKGGTHWNYLAGTLVANALIDEINKLNHERLQPINYSATFTHTAHGIDHDLVSLLNLMKPNKKYEVPLVSYPSIQTGAPKTISFIGGSFLNQIISPLHENQIVSHIRLFFYFKQALNDYFPQHVITYNEVDANLQKTMPLILQSDVVILEENSANTISNHGLLFYDTIHEFSLAKKG